ncbi:p-hydroxybenzoic acid efflux pump subunit aaeB [Quillaja saponaria]|uniref:p-hydroxybenzoic acid efflux pump subunit aaeB n=1 Tax=Quillaja saponaria TaxID=32244 RepID=A0AAD7Q0K5_QUISA|nr:p-hydroxybenzoic acid efflux pump subunit aaeB [Quillaja saponaria]
MQQATTPTDQRKELWRVRLASALRTTLACTIVGCTTLHGSPQLQRLLEYPAFSYVTTILIVPDATLGDTFRGCWHVFYANFQVMTLSMLTLWVIGPTRFTTSMAALAVAVTAFVVALPKSTHLTCKQIAFGQIVIVYVGTVIHGAQTGIVMHPIRVASSTTLGALASVLVMLFPYPRVAYFEEGMLWERPQVRFFKPKSVNPGQKLQDMEISVRGMDIALTYFPSFPVGVIDDEFKHVLLGLTEQISLKLEQAKRSAPFDATTAPESEKIENLETIFMPLKDLSASFFLYCMKLLLDNSPFSEDPDCTIGKTRKTYAAEHSFGRSWRNVNIRPSKQNLVFAFKCSLSLGLAVFLGLKYNKENGYWSGLTIAISFVTGRQATFTVANARAQGTAMGSVYGVLCSFLFQRFVNLRFLPLLPWIVFSCFLMHSRMYGQAGGISSVIGALLILGRENYGPPSRFAIARITEAIIGIICFTMEILFNPSRAATLAKSELPQSLRALLDCIDFTFISPIQEKVPATNSSAVRTKQKQLKYHVSQLEKFIIEAESEPNFWFLPFHGAFYRRILESLSRMVDLLLIVAHTTEHLSPISENFQVTVVDLQEKMNEDIELFKIKVGSTLKCLEEVTLIKSISKLEKELQEKNFPCDIELGKYPNADAFRILSGNEEVDSITSSFVQHSAEIADRIYTDKNEEEMLKGQMVLHYNCMAFCISSLMKEAIGIEYEVTELLKWENPACHTNLYDIHCKIQCFVFINIPSTMISSNVRESASGLLGIKLVHLGNYKVIRSLNSSKIMDRTRKQSCRKETCKIAYETCTHCDTASKILIAKSKFLHVKT